MAKFDESKVINGLHTDKAEIGKKYWFADSIANLKARIEEDDIESSIGILTRIDSNRFHAFMYRDAFWEFIYPYEESPKKRMTSNQLEEWLAKGNGVWSSSGKENSVISSVFEYYLKNENEEVSVTYRIRPFGQTEWIEPTVDIYERDCKGGKE